MKLDIINWFVEQPTLTSILLGLGGIVCLIMFCIVILILGPIIGIVLSICGVGMAIWGAVKLMKDIYKTRNIAKETKRKEKELLTD